MLCSCGFSSCRNRRLGTLDSVHNGSHWTDGTGNAGKDTGYIRDCMQRFAEQISVMLPRSTQRIWWKSSSGSRIVKSASSNRPGSATGKQLPFTWKNLKVSVCCGHSKQGVKCIISTIHYSKFSVNELKAQVGGTDMFLVYIGKYTIIRHNSIICRNWRHMGKG